jgi:hypothetical protein
MLTTDMGASSPVKCCGDKSGSSQGFDKTPIPCVLDGYFADFLHMAKKKKIPIPALAPQVVLELGRPLDAP